jgi:D-glycero-D-manno-heptose 1,7-bisphosphate phosphatase
MHDKMRKLLEKQGGIIDALAFCPHGPDAHCDCRKPKPGLLLKISAELNIPLNQAYFVGDSFKDIEAARTVQAQPVLVRTGKGERTLKAHPELTKEISVYENLEEFADSILK